jgi:acyl-CoA thioesterase-2
VHGRRHGRCRAIRDLALSGDLGSARQMTEEFISVEPAGEDCFVGLAGKTDEPRTFGGLFAAQVLSAAAATVDGRKCNSLHLQFISSGDNRHSVTLAVERLRDGRSFSARQIRLAQNDRLLVTAFASFHGGDEGPDHQVVMPDVPDPNTLEDQRERRRRSWLTRGGTAPRYIAEELLDQRTAYTRVGLADGEEGQRAAWFRWRTQLGDDPALHQSAIAFASDMGLVQVGVIVENEIGSSRKLDASSLDHSIWFHRPARADEWLLHVQRSPVMTGGRGMTNGMIFDRSGQLVATVAQEILARYRRS